MTEFQQWVFTERVLYGGPIDGAPDYIWARWYVACHKRWKNGEAHGVEVDTPRVADITGSMPNLTGGLDSVEYQRRLRD